MPSKELKLTLDEIRLELEQAHFTQNSQKHKAHQYLASLEDKLLEESFMTGDEYLVHELKELLEEFEEDHPQLTLLLGRASDLLARMGI